MTVDDKKDDLFVTKPTPAIGILNLGIAFLESASCLQRCEEEGQLQLKFKSPIYYCYSHALELIFKAFLTAKGLKEHQITSKYGHNLEKLWVSCKRFELDISPIDMIYANEMINILSPYAMRYEFRYLIIRSQKVPELDSLRDFVSTLAAKIRPDCIAALKPV